MSMCGLRRKTLRWVSKRNNKKRLLTVKRHNAWLLAKAQTLNELPIRNQPDREI